MGWLTLKSRYCNEVLEMQRSIQFGWTATVVIKQGLLRRNQYFVCGTLFGKVNEILEGDSFVENA